MLFLFILFFFFPFFPAIFSGLIFFLAMLQPAGVALGIYLHQLNERAKHRRAMTSSRVDSGSLKSMQTSDPEFCSSEVSFSNAEPPAEANTQSHRYLLT